MKQTWTQYRDEHDNATNLGLATNVLTRFAVAGATLGTVLFFVEGKPKEREKQHFPWFRRGVPMARACSSQGVLKKMKRIVAVLVLILCAHGGCNQISGLNDLNFSGPKETQTETETQTDTTDPENTDPIDECESGAHDCDVNAVCKTTQNGFTCTCEDGYQGDGKSCEDIDECTESLDNCHEYAECDNTPPGSFTCTCEEGYEGNGIVCEPATCAGFACGDNAHCNDEGGLHCVCDPGFEGDPNAGCTNIDDCDPSPCQNGGTCTDEVEGFTCACPDEWAGKTCETNVDECETGAHNCDQLCSDRDGGFDCGCESGWTLNADGHNCAPSSCDTFPACGANAHCVNDGELRCVCDPDYEGDPDTGCTHKIGDCYPNPCLNGGSCIDEDIGYSCVCADGYSGTNCEVDCNGVSGGTAFVDRCEDCVGGTTGELECLKRGDSVLNLRTESFWFNQTGNIISIDLSAPRYPYTVRFNNVNYSGTNTNNFARHELALRK